MSKTERIYKFGKADEGYFGTVTYKGKTWSTHPGQYFKSEGSCRKWLQYRTEGRYDKLEGARYEYARVLLPIGYAEKYADLIKKHKFSAHIREALIFFEKNSGKHLTDRK